MGLRGKTWERGVDRIFRNRVAEAKAGSIVDGRGARRSTGEIAKRKGAALEPRPWFVMPFVRVYLSRKAPCARTAGCAIAMCGLATAAPPPGALCPSNTPTAP